MKTAQAHIALRQFNADASYRVDNVGNYRPEKLFGFYRAARRVFGQKGYNGATAAAAGDVPVTFMDIWKIL